MPEINPSSYSPLTLAFYGDAVYSLLVRRYLVKIANRPAGELHSMAVKLVRAGAQAKGIAAIADKLTDKEMSVFKRGRNAHVGHTPKSSTDAEYHAATGLEALFGYLSLAGMDDRAEELFGMIIDATEPLE